ncbi:MAG: lipase maturation factor family protein [Verrucomicrobiota bacterium]|nr:lipase maturation factor family protein [Verrucomicrobiota bacterium]
MRRSGRSLPNESKTSPRRVASPPPKPLLLFDGGCHFCRRWVERWREMTRGKFEAASAQEAGDKFPEIGAEEFQRAVQFVDEQGNVFSGAAAVFHSLGQASRGRWLAKAYEHLPGFAAITGAIYGCVARHRQAASAVTRALWGDDVRRPTYFAARRGFLRTLGLVYLLAFISVWVQVDGLMGAHGLIPARELLGSIRADSNVPRALLFLQEPTLCWLSSSDAMLHGLCIFGTLAAALLAFGLIPIPTLLCCFVSYLSLVNAGEFFFSYQWDILLLETGFVALFIAPWQWRLRRGHDQPISRAGLFLVKLLLFKLMFMSGVVKLSSGDDLWLKLTALDYHYWTQPLPTVFAWFADEGPEWLKKFSVAAALFIEIVVPFFIWAPRRLRVGAAILLIALQIAIALTGNYCFFNLLTIALCLLLIDDVTWAPRRARPAAANQPASRAATLAALAALLVMLPVNLWQMRSAISPAAAWPRALAAVHARLAPFGLTNGYGLFRVMTKERPEIIFEGSADAFEWKAYEFRWKPGRVTRMPQWNAPHQPRLDWSMWFAALGSQRDAIVAQRLVQHLLENDPAVLRLLADNPFPTRPPQFVRASLYQYHFSSAEERRRTGAWWTRTLRAQYLPALTREDFRR